jgi:hypothetical protein
MTTTHRARVEATLAEAATNHAALLERLSPEMRAALLVDAQGLAGAIDLVAEAAGLSPAQRRALGATARREPRGDARSRLRRRAVDRGDARGVVRRGGSGAGRRAREPRRARRRRGAGRGG